MSGIFNTLNTANKGLLASQTSLHTVGHNISNANTDGYSRQRVELKADLAYTYGGVGQLGTGVKMSAIVRLVDDYVTKQIRKENGTLQQYTAKSEVMEQLEIIFNEPSDTGLNFNLGEMFDSWQELSKNPESLNSKTIVVEKSRTMAETLNHIANQLSSLKEDTVGQIEKNAMDFNSIVEKIDTLNKQIFNISIKGQVPNDLLDQRDLLLKDLSSIADINATPDSYGRVKIEVGGETILDESSRKEIAYDKTSGNLTLKDDTTKTLDVKSGKILGYKTALTELDKEMKNLDDFAKTMATAINDMHSKGVHKEDFFASEDGGEITASNIKVNIDENKVNAGYPTTEGGNTIDPPEGDGSLALDIARLRNEKLPFGNGENTIEGAYNDIVTKVGISKEQSDNMVENQETLLDQLTLRRESTSGVSIDEEVTNMIKFQSAYEANAKMISVLSEMLDVLINRTGV
jgi:flagellar hook-associated protein 1 FlgK